MAISNTAEMRQAGLEIADEIRKGKIDPKKSNAIATMFKVVLQSARLDMEMLRQRRLAGRQVDDRSVSLIGHSKPKARHG